MSFGCKVAVFFLSAAAINAQPPLTTIQDTIYKADGTLMNATAVITWNSFEASDTSDIGTQSTSVSVVNGNIYVQLVPNTTAVPSNPYLVTYTSDGMTQFQETWMVPPSTSPLRIRDVRVSSSPVSGSAPITGSGGVANPVTESSVTGLVSDLAARPLKGSTYTIGRVAIVDTNGAISSVSGSFNDCVYVNGTSGPCFDPTQLPTYSDSETPAGVVDGSNASFALKTAPVPTPSLMLSRNGLIQKQGFDYTISGSVVQFSNGATPQPGDTLIAWYRAPSTQAAQQSGQTTVPVTLNTAIPQVICSSIGTQTSSAALTSLGSCTVPANFLAAGDRLEVKFLYQHTGSGTGFTFGLTWGGSTIMQRVGATADAFLSGHAEASITAGPALFNTESYGTVLPFQTAFVTSPVSNISPIQLNFQGALTSATTDSINLANFSVVRYPATTNP